MTKRECAVVMAFTGVTMLKGEEIKIFYDYLEELFGRPVYSHELENELCWAEIKEKSQKDFVEICRMAADPITNGDRIRSMTDEKPTIEPKVRNGRWIPTEYDSYADGAPVWDKWECSECGHEHRGEEDTLTLFCPNCGAKLYQTGGMISKELFAEIAEIGGADND